MNPEPELPDSESVDLAATLADIETHALEQQAEAFGRLHEQLRERLEGADATTDETAPA